VKIVVIIIEIVQNDLNFMKNVISTALEVNLYNDKIIADLTEVIKQNGIGE